jgi:hypothetical protein
MDSSIRILPLQKRGFSRLTIRPINPSTVRHRRLIGGFVMKNIFFLGLIVVTALAAGCAGTQYSLMPEKEGNRVVYTQQETGRKVTVEIGSAFSYEGETYRDRKGVRIAGYVFSGKPGKIFVARLLVSEFEKITGLDVPKNEDRLREFPPGTFFNEVYCDLVWAKAVTMGDEIVIAAYKKELLDEGITCEAIDSLDAFSTRYPEVVESFNKVGEQSIQMHAQ